MSLNIHLEQQQRIMGADGAILWSGSQLIGQSFIIQVAAAGTTIPMGNVVQYDATNSVIPRPETVVPPAVSAADLPMSFALFGNISPAAANAVNLIGVAQEPIAAGKRGLVAGSGSLVGCATNPAATLVIGSFVGSFVTTAGLCAVVVVGVGTNTILGAVFKINTAGATGTGSPSFAGILVKGGSTAIT